MVHTPPVVVAFIAEMATNDVRPLSGDHVARFRSPTLA
jgi:hypothetical protein